MSFTLWLSLLSACCYLLQGEELPFCSILYALSYFPLSALGDNISVYVIRLCKIFNNQVFTVSVKC